MPAAPDAARLLADAADALRREGIDDGRLEAEVLLAHALGMDRTHLIARLRDAVDGGTARTFVGLLARRLRHEPLAYITGHREFYGMDVVCAPGALIPRPETELLVDIALAELGARGHALRITDIGTGSGAIAIAIVVNAAQARVVAIDVSEDALALARANAARLEVAERISFAQGDLLDGWGEFDVIVANLPYISDADWLALSPEIRDHEPRGALVPGLVGTEAIVRLLEQAPPHLAPGGLLACEIGATQAPELLAVAGSCFPGGVACVKKDLARHDRVLVVRG